MLTRDEVHPARRAWVPPVLASLLLAVLAGCAGTAGAPSSPGPATPGSHTTGAPSAGHSPADVLSRPPLRPGHARTGYWPG